MSLSFILNTWLDRPTVYILSDSKFITDLLNRISFSVEFEDLVAHVLSLKKAYAPRHQTILFCWVPGHVGLAGNNVADEMANVGSSSLRSLPLLIPTGTSYFEYHISDNG